MGKISRRVKWRKFAHVKERVESSCLSVSIIMCALCCVLLFAARSLANPRALLTLQSPGSESLRALKPRVEECEIDVSREWRVRAFQLTAALMILKCTNRHTSLSFEAWIHRPTHAFRFSLPLYAVDEARSVQLLPAARWATGDRVDFAITSPGSHTGLPVPQ